MSERMQNCLLVLLAALYLLCTCEAALDRDAIKQNCTAQYYSVSGDVKSYYAEFWQSRRELLASSSYCYLLGNLFQCRRQGLPLGPYGPDIDIDIDFVEEMRLNETLYECDIDYDELSNTDYIYKYLTASEKVTKNCTITMENDMERVGDNALKRCSLLDTFFVCLVRGHGREYGYLNERSIVETEKLSQGLTYCKPDYVKLAHQVASERRAISTDSETVSRECEGIYADDMFRLNDTEKEEDEIRCPLAEKYFVCLVKGHESEYGYNPDARIVMAASTCDVDFDKLVKKVASESHLSPYDTVTRKCKGSFVGGIDEVDTDSGFYWRHRCNLVNGLFECLIKGHGMENEYAKDIMYVENLKAQRKMSICDMDYEGLALGVIYGQNFNDRQRVTWNCTQTFRNAWNQLPENWHDHVQIAACPLANDFFVCLVNGHVTDTSHVDDQTLVEKEKLERNISQCETNYDDLVEKVSFRRVATRCLETFDANSAGVGDGDAGELCGLIEKLFVCVVKTYKSRTGDVATGVEAGKNVVGDVTSSRHITCDLDFEEWTKQATDSAVPTLRVATFWEVVILAVVTLHVPKAFST